MTLRLMLMRHAKSAFVLDSSRDHERALTDLGRQSVAPMAQLALELGWRPELVYVSDALRTLETAKLFASQFTPCPELTKTHAFYQVSGSEMTSFVKEQNPEAKTLLLVGHNPTMESLLEDLTGEYRTFHPTSLALLRHPANAWSEAFEQNRSWELTHFLSEA